MEDEQISPSNDIEIIEGTKDYMEEGNEEDDIEIEKALGNFKNDPASRRSRPRRVPYWKMNIEDEDKIPKMPEKIIPEPKKEVFEKKLKELYDKCAAKTKSINDLFAKRKGEFTSDDKNSGLFEEKKKLFEEQKHIREEIKKMEENAGTSEIRSKINELNNSLKEYERYKFSKKPEDIVEEIKSIQEKLSFSDLNTNQEKKYYERKRILEEYLTKLKKLNNFRVNNKSALSSTGALKDRLKEIGQKIDINKKEIEQVKAKRELSKPEIAAINEQIRLLKEDRTNFYKEIDALKKENRQALFEYRQQQEEIKYIKDCQEQIKKLKKQAEKDKRRREKEAKMLEKKGESQGILPGQKIEYIKEVKKKNDDQIKRIEELTNYFINLLPKQKKSQETEEEVKMNAIKELDDQLNSGKLTIIKKEEDEFGVAGPSKKKKGKKPSGGKKEKILNYLDVDIEIIKKINETGLEPPKKIDDLNNFIIELNKKKIALEKDNCVVEENEGKAEEKVEEDDKLNKKIDKRKKKDNLVEEKQEEVIEIKKEEVVEEPQISEEPKIQESKPVVEEQNTASEEPKVQEKKQKKKKKKAE